MCDGADDPLMMSASTAFSSAKQNWHREPTSGTHRLVPHGVELIAVMTRCALGCLLIAIRAGTLVAEIGANGTKGAS